MPDYSTEPGIRFQTVPITTRTIFIRRRKDMKSVRISFVLVLILALAFVSTTKADNHQSQSLTIVWAEWDPANYLQELSKDFTT